MVYCSSSIAFGFCCSALSIFGVPLAGFAPLLVPPVGADVVDECLLNGLIDEGGKFGCVCFLSARSSAGAARCS